MAIRSRFKRSTLFPAILRGLAFTIAIALVAPLPRAQESAALSSPASVVKPTVYSSVDPVPQNSQFEVAVVIEIASGFHMNSNHPSESYLIPTTLTAQLPSGLRLLRTYYPPGQLEKFSFSPNKPLNVYTGHAEIRLRISASGAAPTGVLAIPATLRYQACNSNTCLQPVKVPIKIRVSIAPAGSKAQLQHRELFPPLPSTD